MINGHESPWQGVHTEFLPQPQSWSSLWRLPHSQWRKASSLGTHSPHWSLLLGVSSLVSLLPIFPPCPNKGTFPLCPLVKWGRGGPLFWPPDTKSVGGEPVSAFTSLLMPPSSSQVAFGLVLLFSFPHVPGREKKEGHQGP